MDDLAHHRRRGLYEVCQRLVTAPGAPLGWGVVSAVAVLAGPLGSFEALGFLERLAIWPVVIAVCIAVGSGLRLWVERHVPGEMAQALWLAGLCALVLWLPLHLLTGHMIVDSPAHLPHALTVMALVAVSSLGVSALRGLMARPAGDSGSAPVTGPRLLARLAPAQRGPVLRISGRDHYVEVTTTAGTARLLLRFSDALAELDGTEGLRVHRSHWVARGFVTGGQRDGGRATLHLADGSTVPVSRWFLPQVCAAGLLSDAPPAAPRSVGRAQG